MRESVTKQKENGKELLKVYVHDKNIQVGRWLNLTGEICATQQPL
jgi:hypothetical protein